MTRPILVAGRRPATVTDTEWEAAAERLPFEALKGIRASSEKWVAAIATILGIFSVAALVKGPSDVAKVDPGWVVIIALAVAAAIGLAVRATYLASKAAYGIPARVYAVGSAVRVSQLDQADRAASYLRTAIGDALAAVALVGLAVSILWFATPREASVPSSILVVKADGEVVCGSIQAADDSRTISVKPKDARAQSIPSGDIASITVVAACP